MFFWTEGKIFIIDEWVRAQELEQVAETSLFTFTLSM